MIFIRRALLAGACATLMAASTAGAQHAAFSRGTALVGGTAGISVTHVDGNDDNPTTIFLNPQALYFFTSRLAVGASANLSVASSDAEKSNSIGVAPTVRFYFRDTPANLRPYVNGAIFINRTKTTQETIPEIESTQTIIAPDVAFGITYMLSDDVGLLSEAYFTKRMNTIKANTEVKVNGSSYGLRFGLNIFLH